MRKQLMGSVFVLIFSLFCLANYSYSEDTHPKDKIQDSHQNHKINLASIALSPMECRGKVANITEYKTCMKQYCDATACGKYDACKKAVPENCNRGFLEGFEKMEETQGFKNIDEKAIDNLFSVPDNSVDKKVGDRGIASDPTL